MSLTERLLHFAIGGGIGFILGYIVARLRLIDVKVEIVKDDVEAIVKKKDEEGFMRVPLVADFAYLFALGLILAGLWQMHNQREDDKVDRDRVAVLALCNTEYLRAQAQYLGIFLKEPPADQTEQKAAFIQYTNLLQAFSDRDPHQLDGSTYTNKKALQSCIGRDIVKEIKSR